MLGKSRDAGLETEGVESKSNTRDKCEEGEKETETQVTKQCYIYIKTGGQDASRGAERQAGDSFRMTLNTPLVTCGGLLGTVCPTSLIMQAGKYLKKLYLLTYFIT